jgi:hypothetical protein
MGINLEIHPLKRPQNEGVERKKFIFSLYCQALLESAMIKFKFFLG